MARDKLWREAQIRRARRRQAARDWKNLGQLLLENRWLIYVFNLAVIVAALLWWFGGMILRGMID